MIETKLVPPARYAVQIRGVDEVTLHGTADLAFWGRRLRPFGLGPRDVGGRARMLISATSSRFLGVPFREVAVVVEAGPLDGGTEAVGYFLVRAFNSSALFAFVDARPSIRPTTTPASRPGQLTLPRPRPPGW